jgi:hypothetical protein
MGMLANTQWSDARWLVNACGSFGTLIANTKNSEFRTR